jgi:predicted DNA-binding ribbon-helix-helix protein
MCQIFAGQPTSNYEPERRSMRMGGFSTSIQLERIFWRILEEIAEADGSSVARFVAKLHDEVIATHGEARNFTSMLRCCCLIYMDQTNGQGNRTVSVPRGNPAAHATALAMAKDAAMAVG